MESKAHTTQPNLSPPSYTGGTTTNIAAPNVTVTTTTSSTPMQGPTTFVVMQGGGPVCRHCQSTYMIEEVDKCKLACLIFCVGIWAVLCIPKTLRCGSCHQTQD